MDSNLIKSESTFEFRLDGDNSIDAQLLAKTITDFAELTKIATREENPEAYIKLNVTAFENGSFQIDFSTVVEVAKSFFQSASVVGGLALTVVGIVKGCFEIKKHLKGREPKSIEQKGSMVVIENQSGEKTEVPKSSSVVLSNIQADQLTINISSYVKEHNPEGGFTFSSATGNLVCGAEDVKEIAKALPITVTTNCQRTQATANLIIKKADVLGRSAWEFYYGEKRILANINDEEWLERLHGRAFTIGYQDMINATMEIYVDIDLVGIPIEGTEKYTITKIHGDIINSDALQSSL